MAGLRTRFRDVASGRDYYVVGPPATAFVVWKGHRDYEEVVAACESQAAADRFVAERSVTVRGNFYGKPELMAPDGEPWGIEEVPWLPRVAGIDAPFASAWPGAPVDGRWLDSSWSRADTAASAVLLAAVASRRWLFAAGFAAGSALTAWRAAEMFRRR